MPLGPWAIAKRSLRIQIVFSNPPQNHLLDGVMDKALTFKAEGPGFKSRLGHWNSFKNYKISLFNWGYKWTWMLTLSLRCLVPGLQWKCSWAAVEMPGLRWKSSWAAVEMPGLQWKWLSEQRLESGFYHGEWRQRQRKAVSRAAADSVRQLKIGHFSFRVLFFKKSRWYWTIGIWFFDFLQLWTFAYVRLLKKP